MMNKTYISNWDMMNCMRYIPLLWCIKKEYEVQEL